MHPLLAVPTETVLRDVHFTWSGAQLIHECEQGRITTYHYEPDSLVPLAKEVRHPTTDGAEGSDRHSTERFSIVTDHLGSPTEMLDDAGRIAWRAQLNLYGVPTIEVGDAEDCPLRFQGQYEDTETGLYQNRFRYYDPEAGQYISPDPIGLRGGLQPYGYVADPTAWVDPLGLAGCEGKDYEFNMVENPGPLASLPRNPAEGFAGGRYNATTLTEDTVLYRGGSADSPFGQWFTREPPASVAHVRIESAVKQHWIDPVTGASSGSSPIDTVWALKIPKGTTIYEGPVSYQGGPYLGGGEQIFVSQPRMIPGTEVISGVPLK